MTKKTLIFYSCGCFLLGIGLSSFFYIAQTGLIIAALAVAALLWFRLSASLVLLSCLLLGFGRFQLALPVPALPQSGVSAFTAQVLWNEEGPGQSQLTVGAQLNKNLQARIMLTAPRYPQLRYGDVVLVRCQLQAISEVDQVGYLHYLQLHSIQYLCQRPLVSYQGRQESLLSKLFEIKYFMSRVMLTRLPEPESTVVRAMTLSERRDLPPDIVKNFSRTGLSHVMAISGMNMTILVVAVRSLLLSLGLKRKQVFFLAVMLLVWYVCVIGFPASAVRASIMAGLVLLGLIVHRPVDIRYVLILTAALLAAINPLSLLYDIGWQLSFLAVWGLASWSSWWELRLQWLPEVLGARSIAAATLAAQMFTWPLMIFYFHSFSTIFLVTNLAVIPIVDPLMILGLVFPLLVWIPLVGWMVSNVTWSLTSWLLAVVNTFGTQPWSAVPVVEFSWPWLIPIYCSLFLLTKFYADEKASFPAIV